MEKWVWNHLCVGEVANLGERDGRSLDPASAEGWNEKRWLSPTFLESVLLYEPWASALPRQGVRIIGRFFDAPIDLAGSRIEHRLQLVSSRFAGPVNMEGIETRSHVLFSRSHILGELSMNSASVGGHVVMLGAKVSGILNLNSATIGGNLFLQEGAELAEVNTVSVKVAGVVDMTGAKVSGPLDLASATVGGSLLMQGAEFAGVRLRGANIGGQLNMVGAKVSGPLDLDSATVGGILLMRQGAEFAGVNLRGVSVGGQLDMTGAKVSGSLLLYEATIRGNLFLREGAEFADVRLRGANIGGDLVMSEGKFSGAIDSAFVRIGQSLDLRTANLSSLDLTGAHIGDELRLATPGKEPTWHDGARLVLRNVKVDTLQDTPGAWPQELDLNGFLYKRLGGLRGRYDVATRGSEWYVGWLRRDEPYTPQPYEQLASVLRRMGYGKEANDILYAGRERTRGLALLDRNYWSWAGQTLLKYTIGYGYGYRYFYSLFWVALLVVIGAAFLRIARQGQRNGLGWGFWYSLDMLLPIIHLRKRHYDVDLQGIARYWFYVHQLLGYVLASFLIAGLSGITK